MVQLTTTEEYVQLVERAQALLSNTLPAAAFEQLHLRAMQSLVAELEKRKYAVTTRSRDHAIARHAPSTPKSPNT